MRTETIEIGIGDIVRVIAPCSYADSPGTKFIPIGMLCIVENIESTTETVSIKALEKWPSPYFYSPFDIEVVNTCTRKEGVKPVTFKRTIFEIGDIIAVKEPPKRLLVVVVKVEENTIFVVDLFKHIMYYNNYSTMDYSIDDPRISYTGKKIMKGTNQNEN